MQEQNENRFKQTFTQLIENLRKFTYRSYED